MPGLGGELPELLDKIQFIPPPVLKEILIKLILTLFLINVVLFAITVGQRLWVDYRDRRYRKAYEKYTEQVSQALFTEGKVDKPKTRIEMEALGDVCIEIRRKFKGMVEERILEIAEDTGVIRYYKKQTKSFLIQTKITAYEKLSYLGVTSVKPSLKEEIKKEDKDWVVGKLCFAYVNLSETVEDVGFVFSRLSEFKTISLKFIEFLWFETIKKFNERGELSNLIDFVRDRFYLRYYQADTLRAFIEALGNFGAVEGTDFILEVYEEKGEDILIRLSCIRSLGNMGYSDFCRIFIENVSHKDWRVRAVVFKFSYLCEREVVMDYLEKGLGDENYYVRMNAGRAFLFFGDNAKPVLEKLLNSEDTFTRDTVTYLLEELEAKNA